jgi:hypothetical protein
VKTRRPDVGLDGVRLLGDELGEALEGLRLHGAVQVVNQQLFAAVGDLGGDGGQRQHSGRAVSGAPSPSRFRTPAR